GSRTPGKCPSIVDSIGYVIATKISWKEAGLAFHANAVDGDVGRILAHEGQHIEKHRIGDASVIDPELGSWYSGDLDAQVRDPDVAVHKRKQTGPDTSCEVGLARSHRLVRPVDRQIGKGFDCRAVHTHTLESSLKLVNDDLLG